MAQYRFPQDFEKKSYRARCSASQEKFKSRVSRLREEHPKIDSNSVISQRCWEKLLPSSLLCSRSCMSRCQIKRSPGVWKEQRILRIIIAATSRESRDDWRIVRMPESSILKPLRLTTCLWIWLTRSRNEYRRRAKI